jgi:molybdopterin molybdotransferase
MLSVEEALQKILAEVNVLEAESVPILESLGQVLAEDIISDINVPPLDNSAMDGYAVRSEDTKGASEKTPKIFKVIDIVMAGAISKKEVMPGTAVRIMTGAPIPAGADSVVQFEDTDDEKHKDTPANERAAQVGIFS